MAPACVVGGTALRLPPPRARTRCPFILSAVALVAAVGCQRTPPEPSPAASTQAARPAVAPPEAKAAEPQAASPQGARPSTEGRCVSAMASEAPPSAPPVAPGACPKDPGGEGKLAHVRVGFPDARGTPSVDAELVTTSTQIERGLMYRMTMAEDAGMLFRLSERKEHTFWMHNTCLSLDMLFVEDDGLIVGVVERAAPLTDTIRSVGCPSKWVLEVNAGWARRHGVEPGQRLTIPSEARR